MYIDMDYYILNFVLCPTETPDNNSFVTCNLDTYTIAIQLLSVYDIQVSFGGQRFHLTLCVVMPTHPSSLRRKIVQIVECLCKSTLSIRRKTVSTPSLI